MAVVGDCITLYRCSWYHLSTIWVSLLFYLILQNSELCANINVLGVIRLQYFISSLLMLYNQLDFY